MLNFRWLKKDNLTVIAPPSTDKQCGVQCTMYNVHFNTVSVNLMLFEVELAVLKEWTYSYIGLRFRYFHFFTYYM